MEGNLVAPWAAEVKTACEKARSELHDRELVVELKHVMTISQEGENLLLQLMNEGVKFRCRGLFTKHVLKQVARRTSREIQESNRR